MLGQAVKMLRCANGMSQLDFANKIGKTKSWVVDLERGRGRPTSQVIKYVADHFEIDEGRLWVMVVADALHKKLGPGWVKWVELSSKPPEEK